MTVWLSRRLVVAIHDEQLRRHGGVEGIRDEGLLESALARPLNHAGYGDPDTAELGALYAVAIARNHPFVDGNKRIAAVVSETFLVLNGYALGCDDVELVVTFLSLAAGELSAEALAEWFRKHLVSPE